MASLTGYWLDDMFSVGRSIRLDYRVLWLFFQEVQRGYRGENSYHNAIHALDVTHAMIYLIHGGELRKKLDPVDLYAAVFSAAVHDLDHGGVSNKFLIATKDPLVRLLQNRRRTRDNSWRMMPKVLYEERGTGPLGSVATRCMQKCP